MKVFGLGIPELVLILVVALLIFGPKNLPKLGGMLGRSVKKLRARTGLVLIRPHNLPTGTRYSCARFLMRSRASEKQTTSHQRTVQ